MSSLGSSGGGSLLQVPGALPTISHASLGSGRSSRPMIWLSTAQSIDRYSSYRRSPADSAEAHRFSPAHRIKRHRLNSAHSIDGCKFSPVHRINRHRLSSAHSMDGYRLNQEHSTDRPKLMYSHSMDRHPSLKMSPPHSSASSRPSRWLSPEDSLDRNKLSPSYVPDSLVLKRPASFRTASRQLRRQVCVIAFYQFCFFSFCLISPFFIFFLLSSHFVLFSLFLNSCLYCLHVFYLVLSPFLNAFFSSPNLFRLFSPVRYIFSFPLLQCLYRFDLFFHSLFFSASLLQFRKLFLLNMCCRCLILHTDSINIIINLI